MRGFPSVERLLRWVSSLSSVVLFVWRFFLKESITFHHYIALTALTNVLSWRLKDHLTMNIVGVIMHHKLR